MSGQGSPLNLVHILFQLCFHPTDTPFSSPTHSSQARLTVQVHIRYHTLDCQDIQFKSNSIILRYILYSIVCLEYTTY